MFDAIPGRRKAKTVKEPGFATPPLWIHESLAAVLGKESPLLISRRREAKRRALLQMLDRLPVRSERAHQISKPATPQVGEVPMPRSAPGIAPRVQK